MHSAGIGASHHHREKLKYGNEKQLSYFYDKKETEHHISSLRKNDFHFSKKEEPSLHLFTSALNISDQRSKKNAAEIKKLENRDTKIENQTCINNIEIKCEKCSEKDDASFFITMSFLFCMAMLHVK